ncbi:MAG TPA: type II toxin-antitoxin system RelE/ParE family toxin [Sphingobium sp.]
MAYKLSRRAEDDLYNIYQTGVDNFGVEQAERYQDGLEQAFEFLAEYPYAARERPELNRNSRAHPYRSHVIFYRLEGADIFIQRIRHSREDWISSPV